MDLVLKRVFFEGGSVSGSDEESDGSKASMAEEQRRLTEKLNHWGPHGLDRLNWATSALFGPGSRQAT